MTTDPRLVLTHNTLRGTDRSSTRPHNRSVSALSFLLSVPVSSGELLPCHFVAARRQQRATRLGCSRAGSQDQLYPEAINGDVMRCCHGTASSRAVAEQTILLCRSSLGRTTTPVADDASAAAARLAGLIRFLPAGRRRLLVDGSCLWHRRTPADLARSGPWGGAGKVPASPREGARRCTAWCGASRSAELARSPLWTHISTAGLSQTHLGFPYLNRELFCTASDRVHYIGIIVVKAVQCGYSISVYCPL